MPLAGFAAVIAVVFLLSIHTLTSVYQDIGRHIRLGELIWHTHRVPGTNLFSYTAPNFPFIDHHWLSEVLLYLGDSVVGLAGLIAIKAVLVVVAFGLAFAAAWRKAFAWPAAVIGLVAAVILIERTDVRPEILSYLFLGWFLFVLYRYPRSRLIATLPLVQLLWVNAHIYFFMGPLVFLAWWAGDIAIRGKTALTDRTTWLLAAGIAVATLLNPHGLTGALYPLQVFNNYGYSVMENQSPRFLRALNYPALTTGMLYVGIVLVVVSFVPNWRRIRHNVFGLIIAVSTAVFALLMIRNFGLFALCMMPVAITNVSEIGYHARSQWPMKWLILVWCALFGAAIVGGQFYGQYGAPYRQFGFIVPTGYDEPVAFYRAAHIRGPIFNNFDIGSYLIWKLPEEPVFVDGRPEAYPASFFTDVYIPMQQSAAAWDKYSKQYGINAIFWDTADITPWSQAFVDRITKDPKWSVVYDANSVMILVRKTR